MTEYIPGQRAFRSYLSYRKGGTAVSVFAPTTAVEAVAWNGLQALEKEAWAAVEEGERSWFAWIHSR